MGNEKSGAIQSFDVLNRSHQFFKSSLNQPNAKLMVIGYSFQDDHINDVIDRASTQGLGTSIVDPLGREVLKDQSPRMARAVLRPKRSIEDIKLIGELRRPLQSIFSGNDDFAHGELMRFFR